MMSLHLIE